MRAGPYEFSVRELAGSMGDLGTLFPLALGYIIVCGMDPCGLLVMMGLANIVTGLVYRLPLPIQPMKVIAVVAIAQEWSPSMVAACGFAMGCLWLLIALTGIMKTASRFIPESVTGGIQLALGIILAMKAAGMMASAWLLGLACVGLVLVLRNSRRAPAAIVLVMLGLSIMALKGKLAGIAASAQWPAITIFSPDELWPSIVGAGFAQIPLTVTSAVIATAALIRQHWPQQAVSEHKLSLNMGIMNLAAPLLGGMPMCHGVGGLAGKHFFGARTGGANIIEGTLEILMGVLLGASIMALFGNFPLAILGAMMLIVSVKLMEPAKTLRLNRPSAVLAVTAVGAVAVNMAVGFLAGMLCDRLIRRVAPGESRF